MREGGGGEARVAGARSFFFARADPRIGTTGSPLWEISYINKAKQMQYPL